MTIGINLYGAHRDIVSQSIWMVVVVPTVYLCVSSSAATPRAVCACVHFFFRLPFVPMEPVQVPTNYTLKFFTPKNSSNKLLIARETEQFENYLFTNFYLPHNFTASTI